MNTSSLAASMNPKHDVAPRESFPLLLTSLSFSADTPVTSSWPSELKLQRIENDKYADDSDEEFDDEDNEDDEYYDDDDEDWDDDDYEDEEEDWLDDDDEDEYDDEYYDDETVIKENKNKRFLGTSGCLVSAVPSDWFYQTTKLV